MMEFLLLRLDAPLMSFGSVVVDNLGVVQDHPPLSMITGILANALGYEHRDAKQIQRLQGRLRFAARCDREAELITDYQTADLSQPFLSAGGWTTRGALEERGGGSAKSGTHIRYRDYLADGIYTIAVTLLPADESPGIVELAAALDSPARPLFIGRKCCIPSAPLLLGHVTAATLLDVLAGAPDVSPKAVPVFMSVQWL